MVASRATNQVPSVRAALTPKAEVVRISWIFCVGGDQLKEILWQSIDKGDKKLPGLRNFTIFTAVDFNTNAHACISAPQVSQTDPHRYLFII